MPEGLRILEPILARLQSQELSLPSVSNKARVAFESYSEGVKLYLKVFERQVAAFESHHKGAPHFIPRNPPEHKSPKRGLHHVAILSSMLNIMW